MQIDTQDLLICAIKAAKTAGMHARDNESRRKEYISTYKHDVKLKLDVECQEKATQVIQSAYPDHIILGEEDPSHTPVSALPGRSRDGTARAGSPQPSEYTWVIDPIDGTVNFSHGLPWWCTCVAVMQGDETLAAAIYAPVQDELYTASKDAPSRCNDEILKVSDTDTLANSIIMTGLDKNVNTARPSYAIFTQLALHSRRVRAVGCAALDLCVVARGQADGYFETGIFLWDVAAAGLIVRQAGGQTTTQNYNTENYSLRMTASNGIIHDEFLKCIESA